MLETDTLLSARNAPAAGNDTSNGLSRRNFLASAAALALSTALGCGQSRRTGLKPDADAPSTSKSSFSTVVVAAFDISESTKLTSARDPYLAGFQAIVNSLDDSAYLSGYPITANTEATSGYRISQSFPAYNPWQDNKDQYIEKLAQARASAVEQARALLTSLRTATATDVLNAFHDAANIFSGDAYKEAPNKKLVVFSDMIQQAGTDDFLREDLSERKISQIIEAQRAAGQLPSLTGVRVWVAGATADPLGRVRPDKIAQIRRFWLAFFQACGGDLTMERYGTLLQNYPEHS